MNSRSHKGHTARKRFGQNFLINDAIIHNIVQSIGPKEDQLVIEIGPGLGAITEPLITSGCKLQLIELDRDLIQRLETEFEAPIAAKQLFILNQDILKTNLHEIISNHGADQAKLIGNLPYNISTPVLFHVLTFADSISEMTFMLQKEVVDRICAEPSTSAYSGLSIILQFYFETEKVLDVPPESFQPPPKVSSAVVKLVPRNIEDSYPQIDFSSFDKVAFQKFVHSCFQQRRKTLRNNLKNTLGAEEIQDCGIDPQRRPETLEIDEVLQLYKKMNLQANQSKGT